MPRIQITFPGPVLFETDIRIRISDINYGGHLGNDAVLSIVHEARIRFLQSLGYTEMDVEGPGIIMSDAAVVYRSEARYGDALRVSVFAGDVERSGLDLFYRLAHAGDGREIARVKTGIVFFDYAARVVRTVPSGFRTALEALRR